MNLQAPGGQFIFDAFETIKASRWTMFLVRLFGKESTHEDGGWTVVVRAWRGKLYLMRSFPTPPQHINCRRYVASMDGRTVTIAGERSSVRPEYSSEAAP